MAVASKIGAKHYLECSAKQEKVFVRCSSTRPVRLSSPGLEVARNAPVRGVVIYSSIVQRGKESSRVIGTSPTTLVIPSVRGRPVFFGEFSFPLLFYPRPPPIVYPVLMTDF
jgi:hypothetical protein